RACNSAGVAFKATAGLHHPIRSGDAHGFVNVFLAAAMIDHAESILRETDEGAFSFSDENVRWRGYTISTEQLADTRKNFALSFGSCSFEEPIDDLKALGRLYIGCAVARLRGCAANRHYVTVRPWNRETHEHDRLPDRES